MNTTMKRTWRVDDSSKTADSRFQRPGPDLKPINTRHSYGKFGKFKNALKEPVASHIYFVLRHLTSNADVVFQTSDTTWQAYNTYGGANMYGSKFEKFHFRRCHKASYNRPFDTRSHRSINILFGAEYPAIRFLEKNGFDVTYLSGLDTHRFGASVLRNHRVFLSVGHDEYWSGQQRSNVEHARDSFGLHLMFLSGNEVFWRIRFEHSRFAVRQERQEDSEQRTLVCYKDTQELQKLDPMQDEWTGTFRDDREINPLGGMPENSLTGQIFTVNAWRNDPLIIPRWFATNRCYRNIPSLARLVQDDTRQHLVLKKGLLGHEWDEAHIDNGSQPAGLSFLSETAVDNVLYIQDQGSSYDTGSGVHHLALYKAASGSVVFGAGTVQFAWGLDAFHDNEHGIISQWQNAYSIRVGQDLSGVEPVIQQLFVNLLADMEVFPTQLQPDLVFAYPSNDTLPPTATLLNLAAGAKVCAGTVIELYIAASDSIDQPNQNQNHNDTACTVGVVGAVEVLVPLMDEIEGRSYRYHLATRDEPETHLNGERWRYSWKVPLSTAAAATPSTVKVRAIDDSLNMQLEESSYDIEIILCSLD